MTNELSRFDACHHAVQFYGNDEELFGSVGTFLGEGLAAAQPVVVIANGAHREATTRVEVLLVDDEPELRRGISRLLGQAGYGLVTAGDGVTAANLICGGDFDVVLSDISMPDMNGLEFGGLGGSF